MGALLGQLTLILGMSFVSVGAVYNFVPQSWFSLPSFGQEEAVGATVTTILGTDTLKDSRSVINTNFANLNNDKLESGSYGTSLDVGTLNAGQIVSTTTATSTFAGGVQLTAGALDLDSTTATSTIANGILVEGGCIEYAGSGCLTNAVSSVANSDSSLTISPTTGNVVASLNVGNSNTWTGTQLFGYTATTSFSGGLYGNLVSAPYFHATSTTATSTFSGGLRGDAHVLADTLQVTGTTTNVIGHGYEIVTDAGTAISAASGAYTDSVDCTNNRRLVGGGVNHTNNSNASYHVQASYPIDNNTWTGIVRCTAGAACAGTVTAYAICVNP